jgi:hypothetical protein
MICHCAGFPPFDMMFKRRVELPPLDILCMGAGEEISDCTYGTIIPYWECPNCRRVVEEKQETNR